MATIYAPHAIDRDTDHYRAVRAEMARRAAPAIRAIWHAGHGVWLAIEGSHRLAAAQELGLAPVVVDLADAAAIEHDLQDYPSPCALADVAAWLVDLDRLQAAARYRHDDADVPRGRAERSVEALTDLA